MDMVVLFTSELSTRIMMDNKIQLLLTSTKKIIGLNQSKKVSSKKEKQTDFRDNWLHSMATANLAFLKMIIHMANLLNMIILMEENGRKWEYMLQTKNVFKKFNSKVLKKILCLSLLLKQLIKKIQSPCHIIYKMENIMLEQTQ